MLWPVGLFAPVAADVPTVAVGTASVVGGAGVAVFEATQIDDGHGPRLVSPLPAGAAGAGDPRTCSRRTTRC